MEGYHYPVLKNHLQWRQWAQQTTQELSALLLAKAVEPHPFWHSTVGRWSLSLHGYIHVNGEWTRLCDGDAQEQFLAQQHEELLQVCGV